MADKNVTQSQTFPWPGGRGCHHDPDGSFHKEPRGCYDKECFSSFCKYSRFGSQSPDKARRIDEVID